MSDGSKCFLNKRKIYLRVCNDYILPDSSILVYYAFSVGKRRRQKEKEDRNEEASQMRTVSKVNHVKLIVSLTEFLCSLLFQWGLFPQQAVMQLLLQFRSNLPQASQCPRVSIDLDHHTILESSPFFMI